MGLELKFIFYFLQQFFSFFSLKFFIILDFDSIETFTYLYRVSSIKHTGFDRIWSMALTASAGTAWIRR